MKSVFDLPIVRTIQTVANSNIGQLLDVSITGVVNNDALVYENGWKNKKIVNSFNSRTGNVLPVAGDYSLNLLSDVYINNLQNDQILFYDGEYWSNRSHTLNNINDVIISNPSIGQFLTYNGTHFVNSAFSAPVSSVFGRTGTVVATSGDYSIGQITNSSTLSDSNNLNIVGLANFDLLGYDSVSSKWVNKNVNIYKNYASVSNGASVNPVVANTWYISEGNNSYTFYYGYNFNERVFIHAGDSGSQTIINFPAGGFINGIPGPITLNSPSGYIEFVNRGQLNWETLSSRPTWFYGGTNPLINTQTNTSNILDFNISGPTNGQILTYNSGISKWQNTTYTAPVLSVFGRTGSVVATSGDYSISQITNSSTLADSTNVNITTPANGEILSYNSTSGKWENISPSRCLPTAEIYIQGNGSSFAQTLTTQNVFYIFNDTTTLLANPSGALVFNTPSNGAIQYTGPSSKYFHTAVSISCASNNAARNYQLGIFINGVVVPGSIFNIDFAANNIITSTAFHKILQLNTNDTIDVRISDITGNNSNITTNNFNFVLMSCCN